MDVIPPLRVTISGSYRKFPEQIQEARQAFQDSGAQVLSPPSMKIQSSLEEFVSLQGDRIMNLPSLSPNYLHQAIKLIENDHLQAIQQSNLLWLVLPGGYCGAATAFEVGWALTHQVPVYAQQEEMYGSKEPIVRAYVNPTLSIEKLVATFDPTTTPRLPHPITKPLLYSLAERVVAGRITTESKISVTKSKASSLNTEALNATVAVGALIVDYSERKYRQGQPRDILLVQTHKWGNRYSIVGGKVQRGERLEAALQREVQEETGLPGSTGKLLCVFDELPDSGYYVQEALRVFIDRVVKVRSRKVILNEEAEKYVWIPPKIALRDLDIELNARKTVERYVASLQ